MAQTTKNGTLISVLNLIDPKGNLMPVAEVLQKACPILKDAPFIEANDIVQHVYSRRKTLPKSEREMINKGISGGYGEEEQATSGIQVRSNMPDIDARIVDKAPNKQEFLNIKIQGAVQGISQDFETDVIYGSKAADTSAYDGIAEYASVIDGRRVVDAGGSSGSANLTSLYMVAWDTSAGVFMVYPRGSKAGIEYEDRGKRTKDMLDGTKMDVYEQYIKISSGLCVYDIRAIARLANIDTTTITTTTFDENKLIIMLNAMPAMLRAKVVMYVSAMVHAAIEIRANDKGNAYYTAGNVFGEVVTMFRGVPIRLDEMISEHEEHVA